MQFNDDAKLKYVSVNGMKKIWDYVTIIQVFINTMPEDYGGNIL